jgi:hypothetical protein
MDVTKLFVSQRKLRRPGQIPALVEAIRNGDHVNPIRLSEAEDGTVQVDDGHHRIVAYWLGGRRELKGHEYTLILTDRLRPRFGRVADLLRRVNLHVRLGEGPADASP